MQYSDAGRNIPQAKRPMYIIYFQIAVIGMQIVFSLYVMVAWGLFGYDMISYLFSHSKGKTDFIVITYLLLSFQTALHTWISFLEDDYILYILSCLQILAMAVCLSCDADKKENEDTCHIISCSGSSGFLYLYFLAIIYINYNRSKQICTLLNTAFFCESLVVLLTIILCYICNLWQTLGVFELLFAILGFIIDFFSLKNSLQYNQHNTTSAEQNYISFTLRSKIDNKHPKIYYSRTLVAQKKPFSAI